MNEEQQALERLGYEFYIEEKPITDPQSDRSTYFMVSVLWRGEPVGTRSELERDRAMERALALAKKHVEDPTGANFQSAF